jgi:hypothetical protein
MVVLFTLEPAETQIRGNDRTLIFVSGRKPRTLGNKCARRLG